MKETCRNEEAEDETRHDSARGGRVRRGDVTCAAAARGLLDGQGNIVMVSKIR
ncbi:hypothetical protein FIBSPDRAFT_877617 [Athelia psychrophila]|uniref:Uncharacterized protein n=1 Tax=Athelia psychrophila TaxID=1759441 RepID=A0A167VU06_9AGAM|nr:hypothetical protein FIBSPDRAFT_877617 [Fibularhizoctonia sp. CBS 109695]